MPRNDAVDRKALDGVSTDEIRGMPLPEDADERWDIGAFGGSDAPPPDSAEYVLVEKLRDDGAPYYEQVHVSALEGDENIHAEESGHGINLVREPKDTVSGANRGAGEDKKSSSEDKKSSSKKKSE